MKKFLIILFIAGVYLNRTYAYFYDFLGQKNLVPPSHGTETTVGSLSGETIRFAVLGDSLTEGVGVSDYKLSYPYLTALKIPSKRIELVNLAVAGATSKDMLIYQIPRAIAAKADLITLLIGVNDIHSLVSLKEFRDNLTQSVKALKATHAKIYLLSVPNLGSDKILIFPYNLIMDFRTRQFNDTIRETARELKVEFIDLYSLPKTADFYSEDQFHPSSAGYSLWATHIMRILNP